MIILNEIKQLKSAEGTKHTIVDTSTKKELSIEIKDTSAIRKDKRNLFIMLTALCIVIAAMIISIACSELLKGKANEIALGIFSITPIFGIILSIFIIPNISDDNINYEVKLALATIKKTQRLLEQADFKEEMFIEIRDTSVDNTSGEVNITYFNKNDDNKELEKITFKYENVHYEKDLKSPKLVVNTSEKSGVQLHLPVSDCKSYEMLKNRTN